MSQNEREIEILSGRELLEAVDRKKPSAPEGLPSEERALWSRVDGAPLEFVIAVRSRVDEDRRKALDVLQRVDEALGGNWTTIPDPPDLLVNALAQRATATYAKAAKDIRHHHRTGKPRQWQEKRYGLFLVEPAKALVNLLKAVDNAAALPSPKYLPDTSLVVEDGTFSAAFHEELARLRPLVAAEIAAHTARVEDWANRADAAAKRLQPLDKKAAKAAVAQWLGRCRATSRSVTWLVAAKLLWLLTGEEVDSDSLRHRVARK